MLQELLAIQDKFQKYLVLGDYTFIGPDNEKLLSEFVKVAIRGKLGTDKKPYLNGDHAKRILEKKYPNTSLTIYVKSHIRSEELYTIEKYCIINQIDFDRL